MDENRSIELSVIIPTYNRKESLKNCLLSFDQQNYPRDKYEVIVIDDGSFDGTSEMMKELTKTYKNIKYIPMLHKGPAAARNRGLKEAKGDLVAFTDNDCIPENNWVKKIIETHRFYEDVTVIGGLTEINYRNIKGAVSQFLSDGAIIVSINNKRENIFFPTCNVSFKKKNLNEEFNELFPLPAGEDLEFFWRVLKKGHKLIYKNEIKVFHNCHPNLKSFLKQAYMYGRGNYLTQHIHNDHPLLKEIKTQNKIFFIFGTVINFMKIPRFSYIFGRKLTYSKQFSKFEKFQIYVYLSLHKIIYLIGTVTEHRKVNKLKNSFLKNQNDRKNLTKPEFIILDITHRCNLKCNICEIRKDKQTREFTTNEVKNIIEQAIDWGVKEFVLSGGEPLIREDVFELLNFVKKRNYHLGILSNGIILNKELVQQLLPYLISNTVSLSISLDALSANIHNDIRGAQGCFAATMGALKILSEMKKEYHNINFNVISIILNENLEELFPLAEFLKSLNVNSIQFQPLLANNLIMKERSNRVKYWIPQERLPVLDRVIDALVEFKKQNFYLVRNSENNLRLVKRYFRSLLTQDEVRCLYATKTMLIAHNGDVTTCFDCYGNVRVTSLRNIFYSFSAQRARERVKNCRHPCLLPCFTD